MWEDCRVLWGGFGEPGVHLQQFSALAGVSGRGSVGVCRPMTRFYSQCLQPRTRLCVNFLYLWLCVVVVRSLPSEFKPRLIRVSTGVLTKNLVARDWDSGSAVTVLLLEREAGRIGYWD